MDPKKLLAKEISAKLKGHINEETVSENVEQFFRCGNAFLLLEIMNLKSEIKSLREELDHKKNTKTSTLRAMLVR